MEKAAAKKQGIGPDSWDPSASLDESTRDRTQNLLIARSALYPLGDLTPIFFVWLRLTVIDYNSQLSAQKKALSVKALSGWMPSPSHLKRLLYQAAIREYRLFSGFSLQLARFE